MPSNYTSNYNLSQWEAGDAVRRVDFNADNAKIDEALAALEGQVDGKADASALTAAMQSRNCQVVTTSYSGTGSAGENNPNSLSFARKPLFVHVGGGEASGFSAVYGQGYAVCYANGGVTYLRLSWSGNKVSWYAMSGGAHYQMNLSGTYYYAFAVLSL